MAFPEHEAIFIEIDLFIARQNAAAARDTAAGLSAELGSGSGGGGRGVEKEGVGVGVGTEEVAGLPVTGSRSRGWRISFGGTFATLAKHSSIASASTRAAPPVAAATTSKYPARSSVTSCPVSTTR
jgi:hypothetical protein